ncbi:putative reverse transcriptase domain-containing protein [Tanacetum coccineum]
MEAVKSWKAPTTPSEVRSFLRLAEFSYNNSYHSSIRCAPFEALYGRKCRLPVLWAGIGDSRLIGPELVQEIIDKSGCLVDKTVSFVDEPLERNEEDRKKWNRQQRFMDREAWTRRSPGNREDHMKAKYPQLFENAIVETNG